jgi:hypothetical protein
MLLQKKRPENPREEPAFLSLPTFFEFPSLPKIVAYAILTKYLRLKAHLTGWFSIFVTVFVTTF